MPPQPRRPQATAAQKQAEALRQVERLAKEFHETCSRVAYERLADYEPVSWDDIPEEFRDALRVTFIELAHRGVISLPEPKFVDVPITGQTTIDQALGEAHNLERERIRREIDG